MVFKLKWHLDEVDVDEFNLHRKISRIRLIWCWCWWEEYLLVINECKCIIRFMDNLEDKKTF